MPEGRLRDLWSSIPGPQLVSLGCHSLRIRYMTSFDLPRESTWSSAGFWVTGLEVHGTGGQEWWPQKLARGQDPWETCCLYPHSSWPSYFLAPPASVSLPSTGRNSFYMGTCQDEPEQLDDWNRIAELQQRNRVCPPHLKTCYPLESRVSSGVTCTGPTLALLLLPQRSMLTEP